MRRSSAVYQRYSGLPEPAGEGAWYGGTISGVTARRWCVGKAGRGCRCRDGGEIVSRSTQSCCGFVGTEVLVGPRYGFVKSSDLGAVKELDLAGRQHSSRSGDPVRVRALRRPYIDLINRGDCHEEPEVDTSGQNCTKAFRRPPGQLLSRFAEAARRSSQGRGKLRTTKIEEASRSEARGSKQIGPCLNASVRLSNQKVVEFHSRPE